MSKKAPFLLFLLIILLPLPVRAEGVDIPKPSRPGRITVPQTQPISSTLPDVEEEVVRSASLAAKSPFILQNPLAPLASTLSFSAPFSSFNSVFPDVSVLSTALSPSFGGSFFYPNVLPAATAVMPAQPFSAPAPAGTLSMAVNSMARQAHSMNTMSYPGPGVYQPGPIQIPAPFGWGPVNIPPAVSGSYPFRAAFSTPPLGIPFGIAPPYPNLAPVGSNGFYPSVPRPYPGFRIPSFMPVL